jgi:hypothetical protein
MVTSRYRCRDDDQPAVGQQPAQGIQERPVAEAGAGTGSVEAVVQGDDDAWG